MRISSDWKDYELIDCSDGERLERWGNVILIRPDPQIIWKTPKTNPLWKKADARYIRSNKGGGSWQVYKKTPDAWEIGYKNLRFGIKPMGFKHTGLFPEQAANWDLLSKTIKNAGREVSVLNLFSYTGAATLACLEAGARVAHIDASKGMVERAKENSVLSGLSDKPVRWIVDDCAKFVEREIRRGARYDIIIMDPPSYGRGPGGEVWQLSDKVYDFVSRCSLLLSGNALMMLINSYTTGLSPSVMQYILGSVIIPDFKGSVSSDEIGLPVTETGMALPCGATAVWQGENKS